MYHFEKCPRIENFGTWLRTNCIIFRDADRPNRLFQIRAKSDGSGGVKVLHLYYGISMLSS
ncbi:MAG: hypothetical protein R6U96_06530 [Promethearchaeia archaeon]